MPNLIAIHEYVDYGSAISVLLDVVREHGEETDAEATIKRCIMALSGLPRLDPASLRPKGEWKMKETMIRSPYAKNAYCSECLEETSYAYNFCPNCGADMRGETHDS